jgi:outer membrane receptor for ferrienterochelin and colicins
MKHARLTHGLTMLFTATVLPLHAQTPAPYPAIPVEPIIAAPQATPPTELPVIVVTGTRTEHSLDESPVEVQLISAADIRRSGASDLAELLEREGGIHATRLAGRGSSIEIQGLSSEHVLILVDGRRMIGRINGAIDLTRLRVGAIERVEIIKGPSSALYGADALGGVVNVITRRGASEPAAQLTVRVDSEANQDHLVDAGWRLGNLRGQSGASYLRIESFDLDDSTAATDGIDGESRAAFTEADWAVSDDFTLAMSGAYNLDDSRRIDSGVAGRVGNTRKRIEDSRVGIAPHLRFGRDSQFSSDLYYNRYFDQFLQRNAADGSVNLDEETLNELYVAAGQFETRIDSHRLVLGGETQFEELEADRLDSDGERDRQSGYVQDEWTPAWNDYRLTVVPGLRYDRDSQFGDEVSEKLALRYATTDRLTLRAGYGRGFRAPDFKQLLLRFDNPAVGYRVDGNPELQPERSVGFNLGAVWQMNNAASFSLGGYHNRVDDLIEIIQIEEGPPIVFTYRNIASARLTGIDAQAQLQLAEPLELRLGYGWLRSRDDDTGEELSGRPTHRANASLLFKQAHYNAQLRGVWIGERQFATDIDTGGAPSPAGASDAYALFDARAEWTRWKNYGLALGISNLFDAGDSSFLPIAPRAVYVELQLRYQ